MCKNSHIELYLYQLYIFKDYACFHDFHSNRSTPPKQKSWGRRGKTYQPISTKIIKEEKLLKFKSNKVEHTYFTSIFKP